MGLLPVDVGPRHCGCGLQLRRSFSAGAWAAHALLEGRLAGNNLFGPLAQFHRYTVAPFREPDRVGGRLANIFTRACASVCSRDYLGT